MSFLEDMASKEFGSMLSSSSNPLASCVVQMINTQPGGLSGLIQRFREKGLGDLVSSWVGTGQNLPVSTDQLQHALGSEQVKELAAKAGISPELCSSHSGWTDSRVFIPARVRTEHAERPGQDGN